MKSTLYVESSDILQNRAPGSATGVRCRGGAERGGGVPRRGDRVRRAATAVLPLHQQGALLPSLPRPVGAPAGRASASRLRQADHHQLRQTQSVDRTSRSLYAASWNCAYRTRTRLTGLLTGTAPFCLQCFDAVGWAAGRASGLEKTEWSAAGVVICLERGADLHTAQVMPLPLTVSCFSKIQIGFTFLVPADPGTPGQRAIKRVCICMYTGDPVPERQTNLDFTEARDSERQWHQLGHMQVCTRQIRKEGSKK